MQQRHKTRYQESWERHIKSLERDATNFAQREQLDQGMMMRALIISLLNYYEDKDGNEWFNKINIDKMVTELMHKLHIERDHKRHEHIEDEAEKEEQVEVRFFKEHLQEAEDKLFAELEILGLSHIGRVHYAPEHLASLGTSKEDGQSTV